LKKFEYITEKKGNENFNSDGLSRMYTGTEKDKCIRVITEGKSRGFESQGT
jgi:hypothetical protein